MTSIFRQACVTCLVIICNVNTMNAQYQYSRFEYGINIGTLIYQGDLAPGYLGNFKSLKPAVSVSVTRLVNEHLGVGLNLGTGTLSADESKYSEPQWRRDRSFSFTTRTIDLSGVAVWNFLNIHSYQRPRLTPYVSAGAGLTLLRTSKDWSRINTAVYGEGSDVQTGLAVDTLEPDNRLITTVPVSIGLKYRLTSQLTLNSAITYHLTSSDYLDGFKFSGNEKRKDGYYGINLGLLFRFGSYVCPPVK